MRRAIAALGIAAVLAGHSVGPLAQTNDGKQLRGCAPGDKIDGSTAETARKKIEAGGYQKVTGLRKGCDNAWHGKAQKDGAEIRVVLSPQGQISPEGE